MTAMKTVLMALMSGRTAPGGLALETTSFVTMDGVSRTPTGEDWDEDFPGNLRHPWE